MVESDLDDDTVEVEVKIRHTWRSDGSEDISISSSDAQQIHAQLSHDGSLTFTMSGSSPQGEAGADSTAWILIERLNQLGGSWSNPERPEGIERGVDFVARDGTRELQIQVTRAFVDSGVWRELASTNIATRELTLPNALDHVMGAIRQKAERIPMAVRRRLTLALDTSRPAAFAPMRFMIDFKQKYAAAVGELGFESVWIVGPTRSLTWRVDEPFLPGEPIRVGF